MEDRYFDPSYAGKLVSKERQDATPVDRIIQEMELEKGDVVADLGAGNGYFAIPFAAYTETTVYAADENTEMLGLLKERAGEEGMTHIHPITTPAADTSIGDDTVDKVLVSRVLHHVPSVTDVLQEMKRVLKPGGMALVIEFHKAETSDGPPMHIRISSDEMETALKEAGFSTEVVSINEEEYGVKARLD